MLPDVPAVIAPRPEPDERISITRSIEICLVIFLAFLVVICMFFMTYNLLEIGVRYEYSDYYSQEIEQITGKIGEDFPNES